MPRSQCGPRSDEGCDSQPIGGVEAHLGCPTLSVVTASVNTMDLDPAIDDLDAAATLAGVEGELLTRPAAEARDLALAAHWADLHASDPRRGARTEWQGEDRLVEVGGEGTPWVQELSITEFSIARRVHYFSGRRAIADALDLRHRLPRWWRAVQNLQLEPWIACKAAVHSRVLSEAAVRLVDEALPDDLGELSPHRLLEVVKAKVIEADPARHAALLEAEKKKRYVSLGRVDEFGLQHVLARIRAGDVVVVDAMVSQVADLLAPRFPDGTTRDVLRAEAFVWLAQPARLLALLSTAGNPDDEPDLAKARPRAVLYVNVSDEGSGAAASPASRTSGRSSPARSPSGSATTT